ncbi:hypothetical protein [Embleya sp. NBC_00896]|uniref:hypothetical protein n=1 Tax=Embleya sp. NBC_00896 TaxID=2975961 RepID=UPI0038644E88|nr:hypothetical protein OG928_00600 [Embleya sp. NBC_00896]
MTTTSSRKAFTRAAADIVVELITLATHHDIPWQRVHSHVAEVQRYRKPRPKLATTTLRTDPHTVSGPDAP